MKRNWDMKEVSDGKLYSANDMVRLGCQECAGCSACCHDMGESIVLDPYDVFQIEKNTGKTFEQLLEKELELHVVDGLILPNIKMNVEKNQCSFLDENGRCSIHAFRPGMCRLFPLGRIYEDGGFHYFLQVHECKKTNRSKVKISKWLDVPELKKYEDFVKKWHYYLKELQEEISVCTDQEKIKKVSLFILQHYFAKKYDLNGDFYEQCDL